MEYKDYYKILGLERAATQDQIKRAYRKFARKYHPDINKDTHAEERFKEIGEAYEVLKDPEKRTAYDQLGANWQSGQEFRPPPGWDAGFEFSGGGFGGAGSAHSDFFENLFGHGFGPAGAHSGRPDRGHGKDHYAKVLIDLEDSFHGVSRQISLRVPALNDYGRPQAKERTLNVKIPRGIKAGQNIRLVGQGSVGSDASPAGDLYLEVEFSPHRLYHVDGRDLYLDLPLAPWEAALGATVKVPTPEGAVDVKVPPGTKNGGKLRLKARGIPGKPAGDLYTLLSIALPPANTERARVLYQEMARELPFNPRAHFGI